MFKIIHASVIIILFCHTADPKKDFFFPWLHVTVFSGFSCPGVIVQPHSSTEIFPVASHVMRIYILHPQAPWRKEAQEEEKWAQHTEEDHPWRPPLALLIVSFRYIISFNTHLVLPVT